MVGELSKDEHVLTDFSALCSKTVMFDRFPSKAEKENENNLNLAHQSFPSSFPVGTALPVCKTPAVGASDQAVLPKKTSCL